VAVDAGELEQVAVGIGHHLAVAQGRQRLERLGHHLARQRPQHPHAPPGGGGRDRSARGRRGRAGARCRATGRPRATVGAWPRRPRGPPRPRRTAAPPRRPAPVAQDPRHPEGREVVDDEQVGEVAGRDRAAARQPVVAGGVPGAAAHGVHRVDAGADRPPHQHVDGPLGEQVVRQAVVGDEADPVGVARRHERQQRVEVARHRALAHHEEGAGGELLAPLGEAGALVVRADAGGEVGLQVAAP
jgi:hypothetical protein